MALQTRVRDAYIHRERRPRKEKPMNVEPWETSLDYITGIYYITLFILFYCAFLLTFHCGIIGYVYGKLCVMVAFVTSYCSS
ncbi:hypothetical protein PRIPAC_92680 [Pristionchus pacificus]|uniref:Uncharacterized protein n=1 Tax=Pristionchus pacificus TaxID=54126 RepID=A0A2A6CDM2_PRIPA|nr:hypothetical protein PRIPAC_92680 [Pristionchus pacificus]|eukprot:PDM76209.1 hypothetical protein PRIPAC_39813 [Pristionchus pacificus]